MGDYVNSLMKYGIVGVGAYGVQWATMTYMPQFALGGAIGTIVFVAIGGTLMHELKVA